MANDRLRRWLASPWRPFVVIIVTCVIGLGTVWPAADEYLAQSKYRAELEESIASAQADVARQGQLRPQAAALEQQLSVLRLQGMDEDRAQQFRRQLVEMTRNSGCRLRTIRAEPPQRRVWRKGDDPTATRGTQGSKETQFQLRSQVISLSVSGPVGRVREILAELQATEQLMHTRRLALRPRGEQREEIILDLELLLLDLEPRAAEAA